MAVSVRVAGMAIAIGVSLATLLPILPINPVSPSLDLGQVGLFGAPVAPLVGWWLTPTVVKGSWRHAAGVGLGVGVLAAYLGVLMTAYIVLVGALLGIEESTGFANDVEGSLFIAMVGLPYGTLALPITIPCGIAWAVLVRGLLRRLPGATEVGRSRVGVWHIVGLLVAVVVVAAFLPVSRSG